MSHISVGESRYTYLWMSENVSSYVWRTQMIYISYFVSQNKYAYLIYLTLDESHVWLTRTTRHVCATCGMSHMWDEGWHTQPTPSKRWHTQPTPSKHTRVSPNVRHTRTHAYVTRLEKLWFVWRHSPRKNVICWRDSSRDMRTMTDWDICMWFVWRMWLI